MNMTYDIVIVGAGFTGLTAALEASRAGQKALVLESDAGPGGLAGTFEFGEGVSIEKFYHHWFTNDEYVFQLIEDLGMGENILVSPSRTGMYFNGRLWDLSTPLDLMKFTPLSFINRLRLGLTVLLVRRIKDWRSIEHLSIREWLEPLCGSAAYKVVWEPLVTSKFSVFADDISAVWMWKKLVLRGGSRGANGREQLAYFKGGFGRLAQAMVDEIIRHGGEVRFGSRVSRAQVSGPKIDGLVVDGQGTITGRQYLLTPSFEIIARIFKDAAEPEWLDSLRRIKYLGNVCLVMKFDRSLSNTYWLNVNDPGFPFVGVIEHTNFDSPDNYKGHHLVFLSRYVATDDPIWSYGDDEYLEYALEHLQRMFPDFKRTWIQDFRIWRADYAQPITNRGYSKIVPGRQTPFDNAMISTMAHVYPEDRGTNYAIREGKAVMAKMLQQA